MAPGPCRAYVAWMGKVTVWYDGGCPLCRREMALIRRLDKASAIQFVDVSGAEPSSCPVGRDTLLARFHAREDGVIYSGAAAFAAMWRAIPGLRPVGVIARAPVVLFLLERAYRLFLRIRPGVQRAIVYWDRT